MYNVVSNQLELLVYNTRSGICRDKTIRQAFAKGIDRQKILANAYMEDGVLTDTLWCPNYLGVLDDGSAYTYDYEQAAEILQAAGYIDSNHDGQLEKYGMPDLEVRILVNKKNATRTAAARLIATALETWVSKRKSGRSARKNIRPRSKKGTLTFF